MSSSHDHTGGANEKALRRALLLTAAFLVIEVAGALVTGSLALLSDAAHMFTDAAALAIALLALRLGRKAADDARTYGYARFEILAAAFNAVLLFLVALYILYEAWRRLSQPQEIQSVGMLVVAVAGLAINFVSMRILSGGQANSLNMKGAYLEVWADMLGSVGVIIGAVVIWATGWTWVDSAVAVAIGLWVLPRTWTLLSESINVLLEGVPKGVDVTGIRRQLAAHEGVHGVHDLHVWEVASGRISMTAHIVHAADAMGGDAQKLLEALQEMVRTKFDIHHTTFQLETKACWLAAGEHGYEPTDHPHPEPDTGAAGTHRAS